MRPTGPSPKFVFVCYSRADMDVVDRVLIELEKKGHRMWIDRAGIVGSQTWRAKIVEAMQQCGAVLFFGSRSSYGSRHVATELTLAEESQKPIVPVLLDDTPPDGDIRYFLARLHHLKLCGDDESCAIQVIHDTLLSLDSHTGFPGSPPPRRPRRRVTNGLITLLALTLVAAAAGILWYYYSNPRVGNLPTKKTAQIGDIGTKHENRTNTLGKLPQEPPIETEKASTNEPQKEAQSGLGKVSHEQPFKERGKEATEEPLDAPPQKKPFVSEVRPTPTPTPVVPSPSDTDWLVPGTDAVVIQAIQVGTLTSENGGKLTLPVSFDIHQTVRIQRQNGSRIQIGSSLPSAEKGWLEKERANEFLKRKP